MSSFYYHFLKGKSEAPPSKKTRLSVVKDGDEGESPESLVRGRESEDDGDASSDDLFGEDEINEIAAESRNHNRQNLDESELEPKSRLRKGARAQTAPVTRKRSALDMYEEEEYNEDGEESSGNQESGEESDDMTKKISKTDQKAPEILNEDADTSPLAEVGDYQRIQTRRMFIDKWISEPFFDEAVKGSFVRLFIGLQDNVQIYRMCEVLDVVPYKRPYRLPGTDITVDRALLVGLGSSQKVAKMFHVSNHKITEKEFQFYVTTMKTCRDGDKLLRKNVRVFNTAS